MRLTQSSCECRLVVTFLQNSQAAGRPSPAAQRDTRQYETWKRVRMTSSLSRNALPNSTLLLKSVCS